MSEKNLPKINNSEETILPNFKSEYWGPIAIVILGLFMATISWQKWSDLIIDYGQQLYIPWQLSEGKVLYKDIFYLYGPLSSYLHAGLFLFFGTGIMTLVWFNLGLICLLTWIIYYLFKQISDKLTASIISMAFLGIFAFGQYKGGGNFNFVCSYVYDLPHGILLSLIGFIVFKNFINNKAIYNLIILGIIVGCIFLTKPEVFLAAFLAFIFGLWLTLKFLSQKFRLKILSLFFISFLIPPIISIILLGQSIPFHQSLNSILLPWNFVLFSSIKSLPLYQWLLGIDTLEKNLLKMALTFLILSLTIFTPAILNIFLTKINKNTNFLAFIGSLITVFFIYIFRDHLPLLELASPWPIFLLICLTFLFIKRNTLDNNQIFEITFILFSTLLLIKMFFKVRLYHYGFALAMPATLILIKSSLFDLPVWLKKNFKEVIFFRATIVMMIFSLVSLHISFSNTMFSFKGYQVASGQDTILDYFPELDDRGKTFTKAQNYINSNLKEKDTLLTLPDAIIFNYLTRKPSPIGLINLNPAVWLTIGEKTILNNIKTEFPDFITLIDQEFPHFGATYFGVDFGQLTFTWIKKNYELEKQFGKTPFTGKGFGIQILKRKNYDRESNVS